MTWVKMSDDRWRSAVFRELIDLGSVGAWAIALYDQAESWIAEALTDGFVPRTQIAWLMPRVPKAAVQALVNVGLWRAEPEGWIDVSYLDRNPTRAQVHKLRADRAAAGKQGGRTNAANADDEGRRDDGGHFTPKQVLGPVNGKELGDAPTKYPSNPPDSGPTPYPVTRTQPAARGKQGRRPIVGGRVNDLVDPAGIDR